MEAKTAEEYRIPCAYAQAEFTEKRSRFIGEIFPVTSEQEAREQLRQVKARYHDARHHCWAYLIREGNLLRCSDDGEPQGTAGQPILEVLRRQEVYDVCCVVTRYFGGILLGTGGLTRAYTKACQDALSAAGICRRQLWLRVRLSCPYVWFQRVCRLLDGCGAVVEHAEYGTEISLTALLPPGTEDTLQAALTEISSGTLRLQREGTVFQNGRREEWI